MTEWINIDLKQEWKEKTDGLDSYEVGDIVECLHSDMFTRKDVGSILLIREVSGDSYATNTLSGSCNKCAWWNAKDFNLIEKNYIHRLNNKEIKC
ncbi:MAG: hypothetical protein GY928_21410 [Colwellia sp.]|nr:hypothetical protein [Colwellia sp.]